MLLLLCALPLTATAYDFMVDDIAYDYNSDGTSVSVTFTEEWSNNNYSGLTTANIPSSVTNNGTTYSVTSIGDYAFLYCRGLTSVTIPNSVTSIGFRAFNQCRGLTSELIIPNSVISIGNSAFSGCSGLTSVIIPNSVTSIGYGVFDSCSGLTSVTIPNSVTSIGSSAFYECSGLTSVTIGNSVTRIGDYAFSGCSGLTLVVSLIENPTSVSMGYGVFSDINPNCILKVPDGTISAYRQTNQWKGFKHIIDETFDPTQQIAFEDAEVERICVNNWDTNGDGYLSYTEAVNITSIGGVFNCNETIVSFDELQYFVGITSIGEEAFCFCSGLTSVTIPNSVTSIGNYAFQGCYCLTSVNIPNSVTSIGNYAFAECYGLTSVNIPNSVSSIGDMAFYGCTSLTSITIPNSVTSIGKVAFKSCFVLTSVTIPNSVTSIGDMAFYDCTSLTSIYNHIPHPSDVTLGNSVFTGVDKTNCTLYVNPTLVEVFRNADQWKDFNNIVEGDWTFITFNKNETTLYLNESDTLVATVLPEQTLLWQSSDPTIATVDQNGVLTALAVGNATITATATDGSGVSASCSVTVKQKAIGGDINGDGRVNVSDVTALINMILGVIPKDEARADINGDGKINVSDVTALINIILGVI